MINGKYMDDKYLDKLRESIYYNYDEIKEKEKYLRSSLGVIGRYDKMLREGKELDDEKRERYEYHSRNVAELGKDLFVSYQKANENIKEIARITNEYPFLTDEQRIRFGKIINKEKNTINDKLSTLEAYEVKEQEEENVSRSNIKEKAKGLFSSVKDKMLQFKESASKVIDKAGLKLYTAAHKARDSVKAFSDDLVANNVILKHQMNVAKEFSKEYGELAEKQEKRKTAFSAAAEKTREGFGERSVLGKLFDTAAKIEGKKVDMNSQLAHDYNSIATEKEERMAGAKAEATELRGRGAVEYAVGYEQFKGSAKDAVSKAKNWFMQNFTQDVQNQFNQASKQIEDTLNPQVVSQSRDD